MPKPSELEIETWNAYMKKYDFGPPADLYDWEEFSKKYLEEKHGAQQVESGAPSLGQASFNYD